MHDFFIKAQSLLSQDKKYWANFVFHFTDISNAVSILKEQKIVSRNIAIHKKLMKNDNASADVIAHTKNTFFDYVRFYFRPLTPTQYNNEGLIENNPGQMHCPIPIFFLFNPDIINSYKNIILSEKTLSACKADEVSNNIYSLSNFNIQKIYHSGPYYREIEGDIKQYRMAELGILNEVSLQHLEYIVVRSRAEKETLLYWLHELDIKTFDSIIFVDYELKFNHIFFKKRMYVNDVKLENDFIVVDFSNYNNNYNIEYYIKYDDKVTEKIVLDSEHTYKIPSNKFLSHYKFLIKIDGKNRFCSQHCKETSTLY